MVDGIFYIVDSEIFTYIPGVPRLPQKGKGKSQYNTGVAFYSTLYATFF